MVFFVTFSFSVSTACGFESGSPEERTRFVPTFNSVEKHPRVRLKETEVSTVMTLPGTPIADVSGPEQF